MSLSLALSACGAFGPTVPATPAADVIEGRIDGWPNLVGSRLVLSDSNNVYGVMPLEANGNVRFTLPSVLPDAALASLKGESSSCRDDLTLSDPATNVAFFDTYYVVHAGAVPGWVEERLTVGRDFKVGTEVVARFYANRATTVKGTYTCDAAFAFDLNLAKGWNVVKITYDTFDTQGRTKAMSFTSMSVDSPKVLVYTKIPPTFDVLGHGDMSVKAGATIDVPVTIDTSNDFTESVRVSLSGAPEDFELLTPTIRPQGAATSDMRATSFPTTPRGQGRSLLDRFGASSAKLRAQGQVSTNVKIKVGADVLRGTYPFDIVFTAHGVTRTLRANVSVWRDGFDFTVAPDARLERGGSVQVPFSTYGSRQEKYTVAASSLPAGVTIDAASFEVPASGFLRFRASLATAPGTYPVTVVASNADGSIREGARVKLVVPAPSFSVDLPQSLVVYGGVTTKLSVTVTPVSGFTGDVVLTVQGLPSGVKQTAPVTVKLGAQPVAVNVSLHADAQPELTQANVTVTGVSGETRAQASLALSTRPKLVAVPQYAQFYEVAVDAQGNAYAEGQGGVYKATPEGTLKVLSAQRKGCTGLIVGEDGGVWARTEPFVRYDRETGVISEFASPRGVGGCAVTHQFDAKGRAWVADGTVQRLDLVNQTVGKVEGVQGWGPVIVRGGTAFFVTGKTVWAIDTETLKATKAEVPGLTSIDQLVTNGDAVYLRAHNVIARFDLATETSTIIEVPDLAVTRLIGLDANGGLWIEGFQNNAGRSEWLRFDTRTNKVTRRLPNLGGAPTVTPQGGLWFSDPQGLLYVAP